MSTNDTYLAVFLGSKTSPRMKAWMALPEAERRAKEQEGMAAWKAWVEKHQGAIVGHGRAARQDQEGHRARHRGRQQRDRAPSRSCARTRTRRPPRCSRSIRISRSFRANPSRSCRCCRSRAPDRRQRSISSNSRGYNRHAQHHTSAPCSGDQPGESLSRVPRSRRAGEMAAAQWLCLHRASSGAKVGGTFKMSFRNFTTGHSHAFGGEYVELVPHERLRYTDKFDDPNLPGEIAGDGDA